MIKKDKYTNVEVGQGHMYMFTNSWLQPPKNEQDSEGFKSIYVIKFTLSYF